jgi:uncharacterized Zn finger protein
VFPGPLLHFSIEAIGQQTQEVDMKCERCEGLMLEDDFIDIGALLEPMWSRAWRCLNCGHATDSVMETNRQRQTVILSSSVEQAESAPEADGNVINTMAA